MKHNKKIAFVLAFVLAACSGQKESEGIGIETVGRQVPELPDRYKVRYERLPDLQSGSLEESYRDGAKTDAMYNDVAHKYNELLFIYECVQETVNEEKDPEKCLGDYFDELQR